VFERPTKFDLDRALSTLMHDHRYKLKEQRNLIKSDAAKVGALQSNRVVVAAVAAADDNVTQRRQFLVAREMSGASKYADSSRRPA
jgi:uncharacterized protein (DUF1778 family)